MSLVLLWDPAITELQCAASREVMVESCMRARVYLWMYLCACAKLYICVCAYVCVFLCECVYVV